jgi:hypothetical protein
MSTVNVKPKTGIIFGELEEVSTVNGNVAMKVGDDVFLKKSPLTKDELTEYNNYVDEYSKEFITYGRLEAVKQFEDNEDAKRITVESSIGVDDTMYVTYDRDYTKEGVADSRIYAEYDIAYTHQQEHIKKQEEKLKNALKDLLDD